MMMIIMLSLTTSMFLLLTKINNPMQMTLTIIFIALMVAAMFCSSMSSWYAFLIFLIYVGGMLVMFAYFTASSPNQQYMSIKKIAKSMLLFLPISLGAIMNMDNLMNMVPSKSNQLMSMFTSHNMYTLIMITLVLLFTMVIVVKLCSSSKGPLRTFMT